MVRLNNGGNNDAVNDLNDVSMYNLCDNNFYNSHYADLFEDFSIKCKYYSEISLCNEISNLDENFLSCFALNTQSLPSKYNDLLNLVSNLSQNNLTLDILSLTETWTSDFTRYSIPNYTVFSASRTNSSRGGCAIYVKSSIISTRIDNNCFFFDNIIESCAIRIESNNFKCIILCIYRPNCSTTLSQHEQTTSFLEKFNLILEYLDTFNLPVLIQGDININIFNINDLNSYASNLLDQITPMGYLQCINRATRIADNSATLIDHCYLKDCIHRLLFSGVLACDVSDHYGIFVALKTDKIKKKNTHTTKSRLMNHETKTRFFECLSALSWNEILEIECPSLSYSKFFDIFMEFFNLNFPFVHNFKNKDFIPKQPFMTTGLLRSRKIKENLARVARANPTPHSINTYKNYRNVYNKTVRTQQKVFTRSQLRNANGNSKQIWNILKDSLNLPKKTNKIDKIIIGDRTLTDNVQIADAFNSYFSEIGPSIANEIPQSTRHFSDFLPPPANNSFFLHPISEFTMFNYILLTKPKLGCDDNGLSMRLIHDVASAITKPLTHIFNRSIATGIFPEDMKVSRCIPIFKSGSPFSLDNFRGVVMINSFSKIFEKIFSDRLTEFLDDNNFFIDTQFGFRRKISTTHAITAILNEITNKLNEDKLVMALLCDIKKCFDSVNRDILYAKLHNAGVRGHSLKWIKSYFANRTQRVFVNGFNSSSKCDIILGILQGSILGVLFFLIFINDLKFATELLVSYLFADDNTGLVNANSLDELLTIANVEIEHLVTWYNANSLLLHPSKTKAIIFKPPRFNLNLNVDNNGSSYLPVFINMNEPNQCNITKIIPVNLVPGRNESAARLLGIFIEDKLNFKDHFHQMHTKISRAVYSLRCMKHILDKRHLKLLYNSYLKSNLEYGSALFTTASKTTIKPIVILQKKAVRIICGAGYRDHTANLFKDEKILRFEDLIKFNVCKFMFDFKNNLLPNIFAGTWARNDEIHNYPVRNREDFYIRNINKQYLKNFPLFQFPVIWNTLPTRLKEIDSRKLFCKDLSSHLLESIEID